MIPSFSQSACFLRRPQTFDKDSQFTPLTLLIKVGFFQKVSTDAVVISSNRRTLLFSWARILKLWDSKGLKSCHIKAWSCFKGSNKTQFCYISLQSHFRLLFDMIWALWNSHFQNSKWQLHQYLLKQSHLFHVMLLSQYVPWCF